MEEQEDLTALHIRTQRVSPGHRQTRFASSVLMQPASGSMQTCGTRSNAVAYPKFDHAPYAAAISTLPSMHGRTSILWREKSLLARPLSVAFERGPRIAFMRAEF